MRKTRPRRVRGSAASRKRRRRSVVLDVRKRVLFLLSAGSKALGGSGCPHRKTVLRKLPAVGADGKSLGWKARCCADCGVRVRDE
jgi:hypothetical protein